MSRAAERGLHSTCGSAKSLGSSHLATLDEQEDLALALAARGMLPRAEEAFRDVWGGRRKTLGPSHPATSRALRELAEVLRRQGCKQDADTLLRKHRVHGLNTRHKRPPLPLHKVTHIIEDTGLPSGMEAQTFEGVHTLKDAGIAMGSAANGVHDIDKSTAILHRSLAARRKVWGDHHPKTRAVHQHLRCLSDQRAVASMGEFGTESPLQDSIPAGGFVTLRLPETSPLLFRRTQSSSALQSGPRCSTR